MFLERGHIVSEFIARRLATFLKEQDETNTSVASIDEAVLALYQGLDQGHICLDACVNESVPGWISDLSKCTSIVGNAGEYKPIIIENNRIYLARYWKYERDVAAALRQLATTVDPTPEVSEVDRILNQLYGSEEREHAQEKAIKGAAMRNLAIITGGPGTGKTRTVARILALRQLLQPAGAPLKIKLAAPTGKAADRMRESIVREKVNLNVSDDVKALIPEDASTIHRLLGLNWATKTPKYSSSNPLIVDLLVLYEASMIDLSQLAKVLDALPPHAALILLGDKDQLDAVEPGSIFGEICRRDKDTGTGVLDESIFELTKSFRFVGDQGIGRLAKAVNECDVDGALSILRNDPSKELSWYETSNPGEDQHLKDAVKEWLSAYYELLRKYREGDEKKVFDSFNSVRLLTPLRSGTDDVSTMNQRIVEWMRKWGMIRGRAEWYLGRPVMVLENNYTLNLFNGDIGITVERESGTSVVFPGTDNTWRHMAPGRIPVTEPAFATTIHKSQGSEFDTVLMLIPESDNPVINKNLLYTGITRAKKHCKIWGSENAIRAAILRMPQKASGLGERLQQE
jgi:exodeoxyribonuclease V alpha subunit